MVDAALCSCSLASYPGDGVTVGGAALAGAIEAQPPRATAAAMAKLAQDRFISFLPALTWQMCGSPLAPDSLRIIAFSRRVRATDANAAASLSGYAPGAK
jgi:hypothetical protein